MKQDISYTIYLSRLFKKFFELVFPVLALVFPRPIVNILILIIIIVKLTLESIPCKLFLF